MFAEALLWLGTEGALPYDDALARSRAELAKALAQDDSLAEARSVFGGVLLTIDDPEGARRESRRAIELNPSLSDPYRWLAQYAAAEGRIDGAVQLLEAAQQINPVDVNVIAFLGRAYMFAGREADALAHWERTKTLVPFRTNAHMADYYLGIRNHPKAEEVIHEMERLRPDNMWTETFRAILAAQRGNDEEARRSLGRFEERGQRGELTGFCCGFIHFALDEREEFFASMDDALRQHSLPLMELMYSRLYESVRSDPRFLDLMRRQAETRAPAP